MSYGMMVTTTAGLTDLASIRSLQTVATSYETATSGSMTMPGGLSSSTAIAFAEVLDGNLSPAVYLSGTTCYWQAASGGTASSSFNLHFAQFA